MKTTNTKHKTAFLTFFLICGLKLTLMGQIHEYGLIGHQELMSYYNPAILNSGTQASLTFFHRNQWNSIGPTNNVLAFERSFLSSKKSFSPVAWGLIVQQEVFNIFKLNGVQGMYAGQIKANKYETLKFGINLGANLVQTNRDGFDPLELSDPNVASINNQFTVSSRLGLSYQRKQMEIGVASGFTNFNHYTDLHAFAKRNFKLGNPDYIITPLLIIRTSENFNVQLEGQTRLQFRQFANLTVGYRQNFGMLFQLGFILGSGKFKGSLGYEVPNSKTKEFGGSQEALLAINWETLASKKRTKAIEDKKLRDSTRFARRDSIRAARLLLQEQKKTADSLASLETLADSIANLEKAPDSVRVESDVINFEEISFLNNPVHDNTHVILDHIRFETGQDIISSDSFEQLDQLAKYLKHHHHYRVEVQGHTDNIGQYEDNIDLSERRALAVTNYILSRGVHQDRVDLRGYGPDEPIVANDSEENRSHNRRVEIVFHTINKHQE